MSMQTDKETLGFQAETKQLLHLMIHSLYSNKEIFLRELISNASDAADKLRFVALSHPELLEDDKELKVWVNFDKEAKTLTIRDNGIGMTRAEVINNLGTIAKSGTKEFLNTLTGDTAKDSSLIGQFGVGFYSAFIVADKVVVRTRKAGQSPESAIMWKSDGQGSYEIENITKHARGTEIELHLKAEEEEFLNSWHLRHVITKYSDHITLPVVMQKEQLSTPEEDKDDNVIDVPEEEVVNRAKALWTLPKQEISDEQYNELYKHIAHDFEDPLCFSHNKVEGKQEYTSLLYIPARAPFDLWNMHKSKGLKLYVKRVFIMDDSDSFLPSYLRFVRGVLDSNDLPLNVSRELLQSNRTVDSMRSALTKRVLGLLEKIAKDEPEKYAKFWQEFGLVMKEGPAEDMANREKVASLLRFASTKEEKQVQDVSLDVYVERMLQGQDKIYYVAADSFAAAKSSPHLEIFKKKGIEVLLLSDKVDEWLMSHMPEYKGKKFQSIAKGGLELGDLDDKEAKEQQEKQNEEFKDTLDKITAALGDRIKEVRVTRRLTDSPACVVAGEHDMTPQMERIMRAAGQQVPASKPILEINPGHLIVKKLKNTTEASKFNELAEILLDQAILAEGGQLPEPANFVKRFNSLLLSVAG